MDHVCEFCNKSFATKRTLKNHIETAKYCAELRGCTLTEKFVCEFCGKPFTKKPHLIAHLKTCAEYKVHVVSEKERKKIELENGKYIKRLKLLRQELTNEKIKISDLEEEKTNQLAIIEKLQIENDEQAEKIVALEKMLEYGKGILDGYKVAKPPNVITNNNIINQKLAKLKVDNIRPLTRATILEDVPKYTYELFLKCESGLVEYMVNMTQLQLEDGTIEQNYACTDKSRNTFHRLMESKEWVQDGGARYINETMDSLANTAEAHYQTFFQKMRSNTDPTDDEYYRNKCEKLLRFRNSFLHPQSADREQSFKKIKIKMKYRASV